MASIAALSALGGGFQGASQGLNTIANYLLQQQERKKQEEEQKRRNALLGIFGEPQFTETDVATAAPEPGAHLPGGPIDPVSLARVAATGPSTPVPEVTAPDFGSSGPSMPSRPDPASMPPNLRRSGDKLVERKEVPGGVRLPTGEYYYPTLSSAYQLAVATAQQELQRSKEMEQFRHHLKTQAERERYDRENKSAYELGKAAGVFGDTPPEFDQSTDYTWIPAYLDFQTARDRAQFYGVGVTSRTNYQLENLKLRALGLMLQWEKLGLDRREAADRAIQAYAESIRPYFDMQSQFEYDQETGQMRPLRFDEAVDRFRQEVYTNYGITSTTGASGGTGDLLRTFIQNPTGTPAADPEPELPPGLEELRVLWRPGMTINYSIFTDPNDREAVRRWVEWKQRNPGR